MQSLLEWISLIVQVGILGVLVDIARHLRQVNAKTGVSFYVGGGHPAHFMPLHHGRPPVWNVHHAPPGVGVGIACSIWVFRGGSWSLLKPCGQPGCTCGSPPPGPGQYEGQVIRKECPPG